MFTTYYEYEKTQINSRARKNFLDESGTDSGTGPIPSDIPTNWLLFAMPNFVA